MDTSAARIALCVAALMLASACAGESGGPPTEDPTSDRQEPQAAEQRQPCLPVAPKELPDGSPAGEMSVIDREGKHPLVRWGAGSSRVGQRVGVDVLEIIDLEEVRIGRPGPDVFLMPVGDPGVSQTAFAFEVDGCKYTVWLTSEVPLRRARSFARGYLVADG